MSRLMFVIVAIVMAAAPSAAQDSIDGFAARIYGSARGTMPYRLFIPPTYDKLHAYPLVIWLHGAGGRGTDNRLQISGDQKAGTRVWTRPEHQATSPAFVVVPQSPGSWTTAEDMRRDTLSNSLALVVGIVETLENAFNIDPRRIYIAGQSDGGYGVWDLAAKRPDLFAAAIALCGGGVPARAARLTALPIWAFHGDADKVVPVSASRQMIGAIRSAGGTPRYTEYKGAGHDIWTRVFAEPGLVDWLFAQHR